MMALKEPWTTDVPFVELLDEVQMHLGKALVTQKQHVSGFPNNAEIV